RMDSVCPAAVLTKIVLTGPCAGVTDGTQLAACILNQGNTALSSAIDLQYAQTTSLLTEDEEICQTGIAQRAAQPYAVKRLRILSACYARMEKRKTPSCDDPVILARIAKAAVRIPPSRSCRRWVRLAGAAGRPLTP